MKSSAMNGPRELVAIDLSDSKVLEFDENDLPLSMRTARQKTSKLQDTAKLVAAKTDESINERSRVIKKPRLKTKGFDYTKGSIRLGSVDETQSKSEDDSLKFQVAGRNEERKA
jgi:hypothetical protein